MNFQVPYEFLIFEILGHPNLLHKECFFQILVATTVCIYRSWLPLIYMKMLYLFSLMQFTLKALLFAVLPVKTKNYTMKYLPKYKCIPERKKKIFIPRISCTHEISHILSENRLHLYPLSLFLKIINF